MGGHYTGFYALNINSQYWLCIEHVQFPIGGQGAGVGHLYWPILAAVLFKLFGNFSLFNKYPCQLPTPTITCQNITSTFIQNRNNVYLRFCYCSECTMYLFCANSRGVMTSGMKTGILERHFSEAFGLLDLHQQIVQD